MQTIQMAHDVRHNPGMCVDQETVGFGYSHETTAAASLVPESTGGTIDVMAVAPAAAGSAVLRTGRYRSTCLEDPS